MTSWTILRRGDVSVFHIFAAVLCLFEIIKLNLFAQGDGRYVFRTISKVVNIKRFTSSLYICALLLTVVGILCIELLSYVYFCYLMCIILLCVLLSYVL